MRQQAVFWLSNMGSERSLQFIEEILRTSSDMELREKAIYALSRHSNPRAQAALRSYAEGNGPSELREKAIFWIGQRGTPESAAYLRTLFERERDGELKEKLVAAMARARGSERWLLGIAASAAEPEDVRKQALFWAGRSSAVSTAELASTYDALRDREMKEQAIFVLSQRGDSAAIDKLIAIARRDSDSELRQKAVFWLGRSKDPRAAQTLAEIIGS